MKILTIGMAFLFTFILAAGCIAEGMGSPNPDLPFAMMADRLLAAGCFLACCLAIYRMLPAVILMWILITIDGVISLKYDPPGQLAGGVLRFAVAAAIFVSFGYVSEKSLLTN